jgi:hypothetical protein
MDRLVGKRKTPSELSYNNISEEDALMHPHTRSEQLKWLWVILYNLPGPFFRYHNTLSLTHYAAITQGEGRYDQ